MILFAPYAKHTVEGKPSPKNYPWWPEVVRGLSGVGFQVHQLAYGPEPKVPGVYTVTANPTFKVIVKLLNECETWMSVDTFLQHMAWDIGKPGVAVFGPSDPVIFGHPENTNLLKNRLYLREQQFWWWSQCDFDPQNFVTPKEVVSAVMKHAGYRGMYRPHTMISNTPKS